MNQTPLSHDITTTIQQALLQRRDRRDPARLVQQSDALLATRARGGGTPPTTAGFLRRYHTPLQQAVCRGRQPRMTPASVADELTHLTQAVLLTIGTTEGISIEAAVGLALVLYTRGIAQFCAVPTRRTSTTQLA